MPASAAPAPSWSLVSIPPVRAAGGALGAVSCASPGACSAVGQFSVKTYFRMAPLGVGWNGAGWARQQMPAPSGASELDMTSESCTSASACTAVGTVNKDFTPAAVAEGWDGSRWTVQPVKVPSWVRATSLNAVSCWSASGCMAVGEMRAGNGMAWYAMAAQWNGTAWTIQRLPLSEHDLVGISCVSATACVAVGHHQDKTLAEGWNGSTWTVQATPRMDGALSAVSCTSVDACIAVGNITGPISGNVRVLAERWDGSSWAVVPTPHPHSASLDAVSCASALACTAVGRRSAVGGRSGGGLAERWNGQQWTIEPVAGPAGAAFSGVSCASAQQCTAVGAAAGMTLAEHWDGRTWAVQQTPDAKVGLYAPLSAVSCGSAAACTVVGTYSDVAGRQRPLAEHWNGTSWAIQHVTGGGTLGGVSCPSAVYCVAVGDNGHHPQAQAWAGTSWAGQPIGAIAGARSARLAAVSCASATACTAVGDYITLSGQRYPLAERWNGTSWAMQSIRAVPNGGRVALLGVSCATAHACTAVGQYFDRAKHRWRLLAEAWNGTAWAAQPTPAPSGSGTGFYHPALTGVSCASPTVCTAIGVFADLTLAERWDGQHWTIQTTPNPSTTGSNLAGVSCPSVTACIAVGSYFGSADVEVSLAEGFDGSTWTAQPTPNPAEGGSGYLYGVSCPSASACIAVGDADATLVERYS
ncbi:MAG TPA: hypothetical protein VGM53_11425 [Streptosporangiaceae bacterium]|jgi:hypothetical protein